MTDLAYILAASHSGSTLLTMLLNAHPDIATIGELGPGHMEDTAWYRCSCGEKITACRFWRQMADGMTSAGLPFRIEEFGTRFAMGDSALAGRLLRPLHRGPILEACREAALAMFTGWPRRRRRIARSIEGLIEQVMAYYGAKVFLDKGNTGLRLKYLRRVRSLRVKVIHLLRDGRAVALTYLDPARFADAKDPVMREGGKGGQRAGERLSLSRGAYEWRRCIEEARCALAGLGPDQRISVRYEDLCTDTEAVLDRILRFLGLDPAKRAACFRSVEHHVIGNGMRLDNVSEVSLDDRWRTVLDPEQLAVFDRDAGRTNRSLGYE